MTVTKTQLADAYASALNEMLADESDYQFSRRDDLPPLSGHSA